MRIGKVLAPLLIVFLIDACWSLTHINWAKWDTRDRVPPTRLRISLRDSSAVMLARGVSVGDSLIGWTLPTDAPGDTSVRVSYPWERIKSVHYEIPDRDPGGWCYHGT
ncbi:MAG: hypothetical protein GTN62_02995 [Gemmatimonadales bacterium]|nr:hypothetical protein [Gemmatimonadales bacterium]NIN49066.1 hypothetical protein [Gemmatimonadales bacterium]NIP06530.1 hypothetical protein [Gemmatimonadales bacterium]NIS63748.1 hypothetical protein [Gemmatimonadales bacterium]